MLAIAPNRSLYLNARPVRESELATKVNDMLETKTEKIVAHQGGHGSRLRRRDGGDGPAPQAGIEDIGLMTDSETDRGGAKGAQ